MKVLFFLTTINSKAKWHQGVASIATYLQVHEYDVSLLEINKMDISWIVSSVEDFGPDIIAATSNSHQFINVRKILEIVKEKFPWIKIVLGGVHVTINPEIVKELTNVDAVCRGEGEGPLLDYAKAVEKGKELTGIENFTILEPEKEGVAPCTYHVPDLDLLPITNRDLFNSYRTADRYIPLKTRVRFLFCRGCPFNCSYCCNKILKQQFPQQNSYVRWPSVERAIEEISIVSEKYKFDSYVIDDDIFTLKKKWVMEFCNKYPEHLKSNKKFEVNVRIGTIDEDIMKGLKEAGCNLIKIGLESGDETLRRNVLNRKITDEMIMETISLANKVRIPFHTFNMVGIPGETRSAFLKTVKINRKIKPKRVQMTVFYPYRNTDLGDYCYEKGMVEGSADTYFVNTVLNHDKLSKMEIELYARIFKLLVYSGYNIELALKQLYILIRSSLVSIIRSMRF